MSKLSEMVKDLIESSKNIAAKDGHITLDEQILLDKLISEVTAIESELIDLIPIMDLSDEELEIRLKMIFSEILSKLNHVALEDNLISVDEAAILSNLIHKLS